jgi:hypothetical protein
MPEDQSRNTVVLSWTGVYLASPCHGNGDWMPAQSQLRLLGWAGRRFTSAGGIPHTASTTRRRPQGDADGQNALTQGWPNLFYQEHIDP